MSNAKRDFSKMTEEILAQIGGAENIRKVSHCFTRLRLDVKDHETCDLESLKQVEGVKGCVVNNGQIQVIIGRDVDDLYEVFRKKACPEEKKQAEGKKEKENFVNRILNGIARIFIPVFPAIAAGGLIKALLLALNFGGVLDPSGGTYNILMMIGDAAFYFLPIFLAYSSAQVFGCKPMVAAVLAGVLIHPTYMGMTEAGSFLGLAVPVVDYSATVFPIIIGVFLLSLWKRRAKDLFLKVLPAL